MPVYTVQDQSGRVITFEWAGTEPPTDADMAEVFAAADGGGDLANVGGRASAGAGAGASGEAAPSRSRLDPGQQDGESEADYAARIGQDLFGDSPALPGSTVVGQASKGVLRTLANKLAPKLMRPSLGAQEAVRKKFPTVDLERVAMREGAVPGVKSSIDNIAARSRDAGRAVRDTADAMSQPGGPRMTRRVSLDALRPLHKEAKMGHVSGEADAITARMREVAREIPKEGLTMAESQARKRVVARMGKAARNAASPKDAAISPQAAEAERAAITAFQRSHGMGDVLDKSQELMALEQAMTKTGRRTSILRDALAAATGTGAGLMTGNPLNALATVPAAVALNRMMTSPATLGRAANLMNRVGRSQPNVDPEALRLAIIRMLNEVP